VTLSRSKKRVATFVAIILLALFVYRPGANGLRKRLVHSIGMALGRGVEIDRVSLRLLPQPGFELENFVVYDDPGFSAEPMLRAQDVSASVRLRSLLHGRLEVGRLSLKEPSFNLVRGPDGHWNLESLLERAAHIPAAPTANRSSETRPVFPYIEADNGRINFKIGQEKKAYSLTEADFALWLASENQWGMRLVAQPVRTDFNLNDTGVIRVDGVWQRSSSLRETPLQFNMQWERAQLGQFTKLLYGVDKGWRGGMALSVTLSGTPRDLDVKADASLQDFRRYDIVSTDGLRMATRCTAHYSSVNHVLSEIACLAPAGEGYVALRGSVAGPTGPRVYDLSLSAKDLPVQSLLSLVQRAKKDLPSDVKADGRVNGDVKLHTGVTVEGSHLEWDGAGEAAEVRVRSESTKADISVARIPFRLSSPGDSQRNPFRRPRVADLSSKESRIDFGPFPLAEGKLPSPTVRGTFSRSGYHIWVQGEGPVQRLLQVAQTSGVRAPQPAAEGTAKLDLQLMGSWAGFAPPKFVGSAQLRSVRAALRGLNSPVEIVSADLQLGEDDLRVRNLVAMTGATHWNGWLAFPRQCTSLDSCPIQFDLSSDSITSSSLNEWLNPVARKRPWYRFLSSRGQGSLFTALNASGRIAASRVTVGSVVANRVSADLTLRDGNLRLSDLHGDVLGGKHHGDWQANFHESPPVYSGRGGFEHVDLLQLADAMRNRWITGSASGAYELSASGATVSDLTSSATGLLQFDAQEGTLPRVILVAGASPLRIKRLTGKFEVHDRTLEIQEGKLETPASKFEVSGTASFGQKLDIRFARNGERGFNIIGTLSEPRVLELPPGETQAALKP